MAENKPSKPTFDLKLESVVPEGERESTFSEKEWDEWVEALFEEKKANAIVNVVDRQGEEIPLVDIKDLEVPEVKLQPMDFAENRDFREIQEHDDEVLHSEDDEESLSEEELDAWAEKWAMEKLKKNPNAKNLVSTKEIDELEMQLIAALALEEEEDDENLQDLNQSLVDAEEKNIVALEAGYEEMVKLDAQYLADLALEQPKEYAYLKDLDPGEKSETPYPNLQEKIKHEQPTVSHTSKQPKQEDILPIGKQYLNACQEYLVFLDKSKKYSSVSKKRYQLLNQLIDVAKAGLESPEKLQAFEQKYREIKHSFPRITGKKSEEDKHESKFFKNMNDTKALNQKNTLGFFSKQVATHKSHYVGKPKARSIGTATTQEKAQQLKEDARSLNAYGTLNLNKKEGSSKLVSHHAAAKKKKHR